MSRLFQKTLSGLPHGYTTGRSETNQLRARAVDLKNSVHLRFANYSVYERTQRD